MNIRCHSILERNNVAVENKHEVDKEFKNTFGKDSNFNVMETFKVEFLKWFNNHTERHYSDNQEQSRWNYENKELSFGKWRVVRYRY